MLYNWLMCILVIGKNSENSYIRPALDDVIIESEVWAINTYRRLSI